MLQTWVWFRYRTRPQLADQLTRGLDCTWNQAHSTGLNDSKPWNGFCAMDLYSTFFGNIKK